MRSSLPGSTMRVCAPISKPRLKSGVESFSLSATHSARLRERRTANTSSLIHVGFRNSNAYRPPGGRVHVRPSFGNFLTSGSDADGIVAKVEFLADGVKLGEDTSAPYGLTWTIPPIGAHVLTAVATDNQGAAGTSPQVPVVVYDAAGRPLVASAARRAAS